ncbi:response regulator [Candidatus Nitrospira bockiana]
MGSEQKAPRDLVRTILVVDDHDAVRKLIASVLGGRGYRVLDATDGEQAIRLESQHPGPIDLLLTDVLMPRMNGPDLADRFVRLRPGIRILYMSGFMEEALLRRLELHQWSGFLRKPFQLEELLLKVREAIDVDRNE